MHRWQFLSQTRHYDYEVQPVPRITQVRILAKQESERDDLDEGLQGKDCGEKDLGLLAQLVHKRHLSIVGMNQAVPGVVEQSKYNRVAGDEKDDAVFKQPCAHDIDAEPAELVF